MEIKVNFLDKLRLEAKFDDFTVIADQPIRYKGDGSAPGPFDYFLASSALCAAYFVKLYCDTRNIPTENIRLSQNNIVDPENRYAADLQDPGRAAGRYLGQGPPGHPALDRPLHRQESGAGRARIRDRGSGQPGRRRPGAADRCSPTPRPAPISLGKDLPLEQTIANMSGMLAGLGIKIEIASWRNIVPNVWSLHIRDAHSPMCFTNGKGATKESALASALGEYIERMNCNHFYARRFLGRRHRQRAPSSIIRTSAGSSRAATMRCRKRSSTSTPSTSTTPTANCAART